MDSHATSCFNKMPGFERKRTFPYKLRMWHHGNGRLIARLPAWRMAASKDITVSNRHTRKGRRETDKKGTTRFDSLFRLFLLRRHSFRSTLRMTTISFVSEFIDASGGSRTDRYCIYELQSTDGYLAVIYTIWKSRNLFS